MGHEIAEIYKIRHENLSLIRNLFLVIVLLQLGVISEGGHQHGLAS